MRNSMDPNTSPSSSGLGAIPFKRLVLFTILFILLSSAGVYVIYAQFAERSFSFDWRLVSFPFLLWVLLLLIVYYVADGLRLHFTLRALGHRMSRGKVFRLVFINIFFSNVTPMATGGGFAQIWYMQRQGIPLGTATAATTIRTLLAVVFIFVATPLFLLSLESLENSAISGQIAAYLAVFITLYLGFFAILLLRTRWLLPPLTLIINALHRVNLINTDRQMHWRFKSKREMLRFAHSFAAYRKGAPGDVLLSVIFTVVFLLSLFSFPALLMQALGYDVSYLNVVGLLVITTFIMYFSPTPGASGIAEGVFGHFFSGVLSGNHLVLVTVAWRLLTIYLGMLIGVFVTQAELMRTRSMHGRA
ncbi:MAG: TIGR00374 family protein [Alteromonadaceae bacterium]|nr:TIGR00374 family protein [Alteromonadaceae bacterium]